MEGTVRNMRKKPIVPTRSMAETKLYAAGTEEHGNESVKTDQFCEQCFEKGIIVPVDEVHHKKPLSDGGSHDRSNLISLCKSCHAKIHAERGDYHGSKKYRVYGYDD